MAFCAAGLKPGGFAPPNQHGLPSALQRAPWHRPRVSLCITIPAAGKLRHAVAFPMSCNLPPAPHLCLPKVFFFSLQCFTQPAPVLLPSFSCPLAYGTRLLPPRHQASQQRSHPLQGLPTALKSCWRKKNRPNTSRVTLQKQGPTSPPPLGCGSWMDITAFPLSRPLLRTQICLQRAVWGSRSQAAYSPT